MFYTYILRSLSHPERFAIRRFFLLAKTSEVKRSVRRMPSIARRATEGYTEQSGRNAIFYTYIICSIAHPDQRCIGHTADLRQRLARHNKGDDPHTSKFKPWTIEVYIAFETEEKAVAFEHYLKSGSGHSFAKRHF